MHIEAFHSGIVNTIKVILYYAYIRNYFAQNRVASCKNMRKNVRLLKIETCLIIYSYCATTAVLEKWFESQRMNECAIPSEARVNVQFQIMEAS